MKFCSDGTPHERIILIFRKLKMCVQILNNVESGKIGKILCISIEILYYFCNIVYDFNIAT